jgi:sugar lactone lactonase YvrE
MKLKLEKLAPAAILLLAMPIISASAGEKPFPRVIDVLDNSWPEGFAIGKGHTAYNGSVDGSIYKVDLRSGEGEILVEPEPGFDPYFDCFKLGMRVDPRTNYLFVAGCVNGDAYVIDADSGVTVERYQLGPDGFFALPNDVTITNDGAYFTDSYLPLIYKLPLASNGGIPDSSDDITEILLPDEFILDPANDPCCGANGIVSTPDGKTLIIGHSNLAALYRVDPATGDVDEIQVDPPLSGFLDGLVLKGRTLYIMTPGPQEGVFVVELDKSMLSGEFVGTITDPNMNGVASGALFGKSLYVNNAHYDSFDFENGVMIYSERSITKLNRHAVETLD